MRFKTLVFKKGTKYQEFYGYEPDLGWITCASPIHMMDEDVTWEDVKKHFPDEHFNGVDLVTIEINFVED
jgi:hypothetical protein